MQLQLFFDKKFDIQPPRREVKHTHWQSVEWKQNGKNRQRSNNKRVLCSTYRPINPQFYKNA